MSTAPDALPALQAAAAITQAAIKVAHAAKDRAAKAPRPVDPALVEKAAAALVSSGWVQEARQAETAAHLADPAAALDVIVNLANKSAAELARLRGTERLEAGAVTPAGPGRKQASADDGLSPADLAYRNKLLQYRTGRAAQ